MTKLTQGVFTAALVLAPALAVACGACIEDGIAATYDHAVATAATARGQLVVYGAIEGAVDAQHVSDRIRSVAPTIRGVHRGTVRASVAPAAFSFALERSAAAETAVAELERRVGVPGLHLTVIRVQ